MTWWIAIPGVISEAIIIYVLAWYQWAHPIERSLDSLDPTHTLPSMLFHFNAGNMTLADAQVLQKMSVQSTEEGHLVLSDDEGSKAYLDFMPKESEMEGLGFGGVEALMMEGDGERKVGSGVYVIVDRRRVDGDTASDFQEMFELLENGEDGREKEIRRLMEGIGVEEALRT